MKVGHIPTEVGHIPIKVGHIRPKVGHKLKSSSRPELIPGREYSFSAAYKYFVIFCKLSLTTLVDRVILESTRVV
ncbi:hypothetical protein [Planomicrobium okeanokoites]|uniref:hypothetical protein n=1 Tax=Planomicrobium okeanokoites TaxID=244 RepID=UPI001184284C|nr:hypothetical protein [Planomicrobium okeanokoites]